MTIETALVSLKETALAQHKFKELGWDVEAIKELIHLMAISPCVENIVNLCEAFNLPLDEKGVFMGPYWSVEVHLTHYPAYLDVVHDFIKLWGIPAGMALNFIAEKEIN